MASAPHPVDATISSAPSRPVYRANFFARYLQLWHLLSLDAPTVAMLWTWFLARTNHVSLPFAAILAMGIAVWMLYAADRLLDARSLNTREPISPEQLAKEMEPRHHFHSRHQKPFRLGILAASVVLAILLPELAPKSIRLYLVLGTLLFGYFILIHLKTAHSPRLPKELAVGVFFSAATFIPTVARDPGLRPSLLPGAVLFAVLCSLNCLFIYRWEHSDVSPEAHPATNIALRYLPYLAALAASTNLILSISDRRLPWPIPAACAVATLLLLSLHSQRHRLSPTTLRAAADLCLLTPLLLLQF